MSTASTLDLKSTNTIVLHDSNKFALRLLPRAAHDCNQPSKRSDRFSIRYTRGGHLSAHTCIVRRIRFPAVTLFVAGM